MEDQPGEVPILALVVELGVQRMSSAVGDEFGSVYYPRMCMWVDQQSGMILHFTLSQPDHDALSLVQDSLDELVAQLGGVPRLILTRDPGLARELRQELAKEIDVQVRESLPMVDQAAESLMGNRWLSKSPDPGLLDQPGMTLDHVIAFADAAEAFYRAAPWRHLTDEDLIEVESPQGPKGTRFTQVLGAGGQTFGLGFVASREFHEAMQPGQGMPRGGVWTLQFGDIDDLGFEDGQAWERHNLPLADKQAYPAFYRYLKSARRPGYPTPDQLTWAEGLLRALAGTTEDELDNAKWEKTVQTHSGAMTFKLSMPLLLEEMSGKAIPGTFPSRMSMEPILQMLAKQVMSSGKTSGRIDLASLTANPPQPSTDVERAQQLCYQAEESRGRRQVQLARQALTLDPDCCDALLILAQRHSDPTDSIPLLQRAVEAGKHRLGDKVFKRDAGRFWGLLETRPYMRARQGLAYALMNAERWEDAAGHLRDLLRLNPGDNQGNRYPLAHCLLFANQLDALEELLNHSEYHDDAMAEWAFLRVLLAFRKHGDTPETRKQLEIASRLNPFVLPLLTGRKEVPPFAPPAYTPGSEDEAVLCVQQLGEAWLDTPGAIEWLEAAPKALRKSATGAKRKQQRKGNKP